MLLQSRCVQQPILFGPHGGVGSTAGMQTIGLRVCEPPLMKLITYCLAGHPSRPVAKSNCLCSCVAFSVLFRRAVNCIYRSSVDVVTPRGRPAPWSTSTIFLFLESIPQPCNNTSGDSNSVRDTTLCLPDSSLPITRHAWIPVNHVVETFS
ncbi:hypothetical protein TNCV_3046941, partial [Trichonephila clavipes]